MKTTKTVEYLGEYKYKDGWRVGCSSETFDGAKDWLGWRDVQSPSLKRRIIRLTTTSTVKREVVR